MSGGLWSILRTEKRPKRRSSWLWRLTPSWPTSTGSCAPMGRFCWISALGRGLYDEQDRPFRMSGICLDITKRKQSEEVLRRAQAELAIGTQERIALEERQRLARELHDSVSQALYGVSLGVNTALTLFDTDRTKVLEALNYALSLTHAGLTEMRALIFELRPESLEMEGLVVALTKQVEALRVRHGIEVELSLCDEPDVPLAVKEALYRIAQEALHNAVKHARAATAGRASDP